MAKLRLSREDTDLMREYIEEGVARNETEEQIKERRKWLADLFGCTLPQVAGAVAWKREGEESLVLKPLEMPENQVTPEITTSPEAPLANESQTTETDTSSNETPALIQETAIPKNPKLRKPNRNGAWTNYGQSEIKEKWRSAEMDFLERQQPLFEKKVEDLRVLCTPGIQCRHQIQHLLAHGIRPENIIAVEREKKAWEEFSKNCQAMGIQPELGELRDYLATTKEKFDVALLDFVGQYCIGYQEVIYQLPLADRAMVSMNMTGKRERKDIQKSMQHNEDVGSNLLVEMTNEKIRAGIAIIEKSDESAERKRIKVLQLWNDAREEAIAELAQRKTPISDDKRNTVMWTLLHEIGIGRTENWGLPNMCANFPIIFSEEFRRQTFKKRQPHDNFFRVKSMNTSMQRFELETFGLFRRAVAGTSRQMFNYMRGVDDIVQAASDVVIGARKIRALERRKYLSKVGKTSSPYLTDFAIVEYPREEYLSQRSSANFMLTCAREWAKRFLGSRQLTFETGLSTTGIRVNRKEDRKTFHVATLPFDALEKDLDAFRSLQEEYPLSKSESMFNLKERQIID